MINNKIADIFQEIGDILEIQNDNPFRVRSYQRAAQIIRSLAKDLGEMHKNDPGQIRAIRGIGKDLYERIVEIIETGKCKYQEKLLKHFPPGLLDMLRLRSVGPKKVQQFYLTLGITDLKALRKAAVKGELRELPKLGEKSEAEIIKSIDNLERYSQRSLVSTALDEAESYIEYLKKNKHIKKIQYAGSLRRMQETVGDIDILATSSSKKQIDSIMDHFIKYPLVEDVLAHGPTKSSVVIELGIQVDLRVLEEKSFGAALHYFTGSKEHNIVIRNRAKRMGLKVNEYGVFKGAKMVAGKTEEEVFKAIKLPFIIPELRKNDGEIEAAEKKKLPKSIELKDIKGDLHVHTNWSDGSQSIEEVVEAAFQNGYQYINISDHSKSSRIAGGLDEKEILKQKKEIEKLRKKYAAKKKTFTILHGSEVDILADGKLDFSDEILAQLDIFPISVHSRFKMSQAEQTDRITKAMKNKHVKILGHPTGRLINQREPYDVDMDAIIEAAIEYKVALEINSQPKRLDLADKYVKLAKQKGAKFVINTDSHHSSQFTYMKFGVAVARRGWLEKSDVLNTRSVKQLLNYWK